MLRATPGKKLIGFDFSQVEGRVACWIAGEEWKVQAFRDIDAGTGADIYKMSYSQSFNVPIEEVDDAGRQAGKTCIAEGQLVLTDLGLVPIEDVGLCHQVWDGVEWVTHGGVISKGFKEVLTTDEGLTATPDHIVFTASGKEMSYFDAARNNYKLATTCVDGAPVAYSPILNPFHCTSGSRWGTAQVYDIANCGPRNRFTVSGKIVHNCELALQFQGWTGALMGMAEKFGLFFDDEVAADLCGRWRDAHPMIKRMWYAIGDCAIYAIRNRKTYTYRGIKIGIANGFLKVRLPNGRLLSYYKPYLFQKEHYGKMKTCIGYWGAHKKTGKLCTTMSTHGGDIFQSIVQGAARDCLAFAMKNMDAAGFNLVMHVHDECEADEELDRKEEMRTIMSRVPPWAEGLPMAVDGWAGKRYRK